MYKIYTRELDQSSLSTLPLKYPFKLLRTPEIDIQESIPPTYVACAGIFEQSMGARNQVGKGFSYRPARLHRLAVEV